jgi:hypothetical protein
MAAFCWGESSRQQPYFEAERNNRSQRPDGHRSCEDIAGKITFILYQIVSPTGIDGTMSLLRQVATAAWQLAGSSAGLQRKYTPLLLTSALLERSIYLCRPSSAKSCLLSHPTT